MTLTTDSTTCTDSGYGDDTSVYVDGTLSGEDVAGETLAVLDALSCRQARVGGVMVWDCRIVEGLWL